MSSVFEPVDAAWCDIDHCKVHGPITICRLPRKAVLLDHTMGKLGQPQRECISVFAEQARLAIFIEHVVLPVVAADRYRYETLLQRTGADYEIDLTITVTPLGAISRLEHALSGFCVEQNQYRRRLEEAERRLVSYRSRDGGAFAFADDLKEKRLKLGAIEAQLAEGLDNVTVAAAA